MRAPAPALLLLPLALAATELNCGAPSAAYDVANSTTLGSLLDLRDAFCGALGRNSARQMNWTDVAEEGGAWRGWRATYTLGDEVPRGPSGVGKWRLGGPGRYRVGVGRERFRKGPGRGVEDEGDDGDESDDAEMDDNEDDNEGGVDVDDEDDNEDVDDEDNDEGDAEDEDDEDDEDDENDETDETDTKRRLGRRAEPTSAEPTTSAETTKVESKTGTTTKPEPTKADTKTETKGDTKTEAKAESPKTSSGTKTGASSSPTSTGIKSPTASPTPSAAKPVQVMFIADQENADKKACRRAFVEILQGCMLGAVPPKAKNAGSAVWKEGKDRYGISFSQ